MYCTPRSRSFARPTNWFESFVPAMAHAAACDAECGPATFRMPIDIVEREGAYVITASVPGFTKEQISIELNDGVVTIDAKLAETKEDESTSTGATWHRRERRRVNLSRSIRLPDGVTGENISATVENGVLTVTIPQPPTKQPHKIKVN